ncbi:PIR Superfamily Protein [Plasmodium ovale curtisi]|uniref:PIR Superfamily Protein n=1 Tax=Plasmodium ovale curtisi TaxID=864141 RepID=A0A1A8X4Q9_PLAOA|nr:PIR Superfamily Protein [Plasmodium ovale curtisi]
MEGGSSLGEQGVNYIFIKDCDTVSWGKKEDEVKGVCKKYQRCLEKSTVLNVVNPKYDVYMLLSYWIYDKLTEIFGNPNNSDIINYAFSNFQYIWEYTVNTSQNKTYNKK